MSLLARLDRFFDGVPRSRADVVDNGPMRAFLSRDRWPFYARPRVDMATGAAIDSSDLAAAATVLTEHGAPVSFEWIADLWPSIGPAALDLGYDVTSHPLLVLDSLAPLDSPAGLSVDFCDADSTDLPAAHLVAEISFGRMQYSLAEFDTKLAQRAQHHDDTARARVRSGTLVTAVARLDGRVIGHGSHQPVHDVTEIVGVAVLPQYRRRGIGAALTAALARDAMARGADVVMLSADTDEVARVYERIGFVRVGHTGAAGPP